ncbi:MAG: carnitine 3-dehydrogenase, partial [Oceanospirillaceae bacterium]|nr:carnitine 3-dehydrogenase [Oceanospirillaceae bacterium]
MPKEGKLTLCDSLETAVANASWIQESVPERLEIKHAVLAQVQAACPEAAIIGSSTSGFKPSLLQENALRPEQIMVAHPFNPVYLLPLVELVPSPANNPEIIQQAQSLLTGLGMKPLH